LIPFVVEVVEFELAAAVDAVVGAAVVAVAARFECESVVL
jgi:hypothetical protein